MSIGKAGWLGVVLVLGVAVINVAAADASKIYWAGKEDPLVLQRANTDGTDVEDLVDGLTHDIGLDLDARKLYWLHGFPPGVTLRRSNLDGTGVQILDDYEGNDAGPLAVGAGWVYVATYFFEGCPGVRRYDMSGAYQGTILFDTCPWGMAVDPVGQKLYWTGPEGQNTIRRSDLDGSNTEILLNTDGSPVAIELDLPQGKMYWNHRDNGIRRADLDGSNVETLVATEDYIQDIALDLPAGKLYWTLEFGHQILRADLDGSNPELFLDTGARSIAIDDGQGDTDVPATSQSGLIAIVLVLIALSTGLVGKRVLGRQFR